MRISISINGLSKEYDWKLPFFPSVGDKLYISDFINEEDYHHLDSTTDFYIIFEIVWSNENQDSKAELFLKPSTLFNDK